MDSSEKTFFSITSVAFFADARDLTSSENFSLSFRLWSKGMTKETQALVQADLVRLVPEIRCVGNDGWGTPNYEVLDCLVEEKDKPGICKHLIDLFRQGGVDVTCNGYPYQEHPLFKNMASPQNLPKELIAFEGFVGRINSLIGQKAGSPFVCPS